jgi:hypothetical protein
VIHTLSSVLCSTRTYSSHLSRLEPVPQPPKWLTDCSPDSLPRTHRGPPPLSTSSLTQPVTPLPGEGEQWCFAPAFICISLYELKLGVYSLWPVCLYPLAICSVTVLVFCLLSCTSSLSTRQISTLRYEFKYFDLVSHLSSLFVPIPFCSSKFSNFLCRIRQRFLKYDTKGMLYKRKKW